MSGYPFDRLAANLFIQAMYAGVPGWINISYLNYAGGKLVVGDFFPTTPQGLEHAVDYAEQCSKRSCYAIYLRTTTLKHRPYGRGYAKDTLCCPYGYADLDYGHDGHKGDNLPPDADSAKALVAEAGLPEPTLWIHSGGGWYPIWKWTRTLAYDEAKELVGRIQDLLLLASKAHGWNYGSGVRDMARILRLVGSSNMKMGHTNPRPCRIMYGEGTGLPVDPSWFPPAPPVEVVRKANPAAAPPPKKATNAYRESGRKGPWDVFSEMVGWNDLLADHGLSYVGSDSISDQYVRDGASSSYSLKVMHASDCVVNWSEAIDGLPIGTGLTKAAFLAYMTGYGGNRSDLLRDLLNGTTTAGLPQNVIDAMAAVGQSVTVIKLPRGQNPTPEQLMSNAQIEWVDEAEIVTDDDLDALLATFTKRTRPRARINREQWMRQDGERGLIRHAAGALGDAVRGFYTAEEAVTLILTGCRRYNVANSEYIIKVALGALLNEKASVS